jgi:hypothetical protein
MGIQENGMSIEEKINNSDLLTTAFGRFPTFHDSEVVQIVLDRWNQEANVGPNLLAKIQVMKLVSKDDGNGNWLWSHHLVELRFSRIEKVSLRGFNFQNVLTDLYIDEIPASESSPMRYAVLFESCFGVGIEFTCSEVAVESVGPAELIKKEPEDEKAKQERQKFLEEHFPKKKGYIS